MKTINCKSFSSGKCLHQAAPRKLFGCAACLLMHYSSDPRVINDCALRVLIGRPPPPGAPYIPQPQGSTHA